MRARASSSSRRRYYETICQELEAGAIAELEAAGATYERIVVPGALEIPLALAQAVKAGLIGSDDADARFDGCVALGCVIRGETAHYDIVCNNANHWLMQLAVENAIPLGNAILTVDTEAQALERAQRRPQGQGRGRRARLPGAGRHRAASSPTRTWNERRRQERRQDGKGLSRSRARLAAVQALYQMDLAETDLAAVLEEFKRQSAGRRRPRPTGWASRRRSTSPACSRAWSRRQREIDPLIDSQLATGWRLVRIDSIVRAILRAAAFELMELADVPARVVISEYVEVAHAFFEGDELKVVNGVLDQLARKLRAASCRSAGDPGDLLRAVGAALYPSGTSKVRLTSIEASA